MVTLSTPILVLFAVSCLVAIIVPFLKQELIKQLQYKELLPGLKGLAAVVLPLCALFGVASQFGVDIGTTLPPFIGTTLLCYLFAFSGFPSGVRGVFLLIAAVLYSLNVPAESLRMACSSGLIGLFAWKIVENLSFKKEAVLDDILPPFFWLTAVLWLNEQSLESKVMSLQTGLVLSVISVAFLIRNAWIAAEHYIAEDKAFFARIILAVTGGLGVLLAITKLLLAMEYQKVALLVGFGMFVAYMFKNIDNEGQAKVSPASAAKMLIITGILLLVTTRLFGTLGLLVVAPACLVLPRSGMAQLPGLFLGVRALLQCFILVFNSNVTGINLMHPYTSAALYAGFIGLALLMLLLRELKDTRIMAALFLIAGVVVPLSSNFFLHAEPTGSLLISSTVAGVLLAGLGPALLREEGYGFESLLLLPGLMIASGMITGGLIEAGNTATINDKATYLGYGIAVLVLLAAVFWYVFKNKPQTPVQVPNNG